MNGETGEHEWKWSRWNRSWANIWSNCGVQLPWTASIPHGKGDHPVWSNIRCIRPGAVMCRIVNWKGLTTYYVTSPLNIWIKYAFSDTLWPNLKRGKLFCFYYLFYWVDREMGGGVRLNCYLIFWMVKRENMNESVHAGIEVWRIFGPVCSCLGPSLKRHQNFDYITIANRLRTVSWSNDSTLTVVVKTVYVISTFPLTATAV